MRARSIAILISALALAAVLASSSPAVAGTLSIPQLRAKLRQTRHHLASARLTLKTARADLADARALVAAMDEVTAATDETAPAAGDDPETSAPTPAPTPTPLPTVQDPGVLAAVAAMRPELASRLLADGVVSEEELAALEARVTRWRGAVRRLRRAVEGLEQRLAQRLQIREWNRRGAWRPLIEIAARRYHVSADGLYRLMMYESGGRRLAGSTFKGLFQYYPGTWSKGWNPWRSASIYDGWAQIRATAYAISRGMGPGNWPATYPRAF